MSKVWSSVAMIHSSTQIVIPSGTKTNRPASSHLRIAAITNWPWARPGLAQAREQEQVMARQERESLLRMTRRASTLVLQQVQTQPTCHRYPIHQPVQQRAYRLESL